MTAATWALVTGVGRIAALAVNDDQIDDSGLTSDFLQIASK